MADDIEILEDIQGSLEIMSSRIAELNIRIENISLVAFPDRHTFAEQLAIMNNNLEMITWRFNYYEQQAMMCDLEIGEVPEVPNEDLIDLTLVFGERLGVPIEEGNIVYARRRDRCWQAETSRPRRIVVRLTSWYMRNAVVEAARERPYITTAEFGLPGNSGRIYFNERLSLLNRRLFHLARDECRANGWTFVWVKHGNIYVRKQEGMPHYRIRNERHLDQVFLEHLDDSD